LGWELHVTPLDYFKHCFLTAALRTKTKFSNASSCSTSPGSPPTDSEAEEREEEDEDYSAGVWSDDSDDIECLPGRPLWGLHSFKICANDAQYGEEAGQEDDAGLPGWVPWSEQSFQDRNRLSGWPSWIEQNLEEEEEKEDGLPGWTPWSDLSF